MTTLRVTVNQRVNADLNLSFAIELIQSGTDSDREEAAREAGKQLQSQICAFAAGFAETNA